MTMLHLPLSRMYWAAETRTNNVANIMAKDRWGAYKIASSFQ